MKSALLLDLAANLSPRFAHERSIAVRTRELRTNRFVLSVIIAEIPGGVREKIIDVCRRMGMPAVQFQLVERYVATTQVLHLGFEENSNECLYKLYLEQDAPAAFAARRPVLQHLAFKWDTDNPMRHTLTRYTWFPALSLAAIHERVRALCSQGAQLIAEDLINFAVGPSPTWDLRYMEAIEEGNSRRSFDLNMYEAGVRLMDLKSLLIRMWRHYGIESAQWQRVIESDGTEIFGHLTGGIHRNGEDFFNVYYGRKTVVSNRRLKEEFLNRL